MVPFIVLVAVTGVSFVARSVRFRAESPRHRWASAVAYGMAAMFLIASTGHFVEPLRSGLEATVPAGIPFPAFVIFASGVFEVLLAAALVWGRTRPAAAIVAFVYLIAVFPANVLAATTVDHPAAPDTPLLLRTVIQIVFLSASVVVWFASRSRQSRQQRIPYAA
jgi:uncharacterized membrane protein